MALIHCVECGEKVSSAAPACPHCGYPIRELFLRNQDVSQVQAPLAPQKARSPYKSGQRPGLVLPFTYTALIPVGMILAAGGVFLITNAERSYYSYSEDRYVYVLDQVQFNVGCVFCVVSVLFELIAAIIFLVWLYKAWSVVPPDYNGPSPGLAVGLLFVPFFNLYWIFRAVPGLSSALHRVLKDRDPSGSHWTGFGVGLTACILALIPYVNVLSIIFFMIWIHMANSARNRVIELESS